MFFKLVEIDPVDVSAVSPGLDPVDRRIAEISERRFECPGDLKGVVPKIVGARDHADIWDHVIAVDRVEIVEAAKQVDLVPRDAELLFGFAQRGNR